MLAQILVWAMQCFACVRCAGPDGSPIHLPSAVLRKCTATGMTYSTQCCREMRLAVQAHRQPLLEDVVALC